MHTYYTLTTLHLQRGVTFPNLTKYQNETKTTQNENIDRQSLSWLNDTNPWSEPYLNRNILYNLRKPLVYPMDVRTKSQYPRKGEFRTERKFNLGETGKETSSVFTTWWQNDSKDYNKKSCYFCLLVVSFCLARWTKNTVRVQSTRYSIALRKHGGSNKEMRTRKTEGNIGRIHSSPPPQININGLSYRYTSAVRPIVRLRVVTQIIEHHNAAWATNVFIVSKPPHTVHTMVRALLCTLTRWHGLYYTPLDQ